MRNLFLRATFSILGVSGALGIGLLSPQLGSAASVEIAPSPAPPQYLAQADEVLTVLRSLPAPETTTGNIGELFSANAYGQQSLNFQAAMQPEAVVEFYQTALTDLGYTEREINQTMGDWGFSIVFDLPDDVELAPRDDAKSVVLVLQGTMLAPGTININVRFDEI